MDQGHHRPRSMQGCGDFWQCPEGQTVQDDRTIVRRRNQKSFGARLLSGIWPGKSISQANELDLPAKTTELRDDPAVVGIASGDGFDVAGNCPRYSLGHKDASYH